MAHAVSASANLLLQILSSICTIKLVKKNLSASKNFYLMLSGLRNYRKQEKYPMAKYKKIIDFTDIILGGMN